jgi:hypothetical protein
MSGFGSLEDAVINSINEIDTGLAYDRFGLWYRPCEGSEEGLRRFYRGGRDILFRKKANIRSWPNGMQITTIRMLCEIIIPTSGREGLRFWYLQEPKSQHSIGTCRRSLSLRGYDPLWE